MSTEIKDYKELLKSTELYQAIIANEVCLFIGAGVASNLGMPNWNSLAKKVAAYCTENAIFNHSIEHSLTNLSDPLKVISYCCQEIERKNGKDKFRKFLTNIFIDSPQNIYKDTKAKIYKDLIEICEKRKALIVQTNYDDIIETHLKNAIEILVPFKSPQIPKMLNNQLVYLHGKCVNGDYENWVFTRQQYNDVYVLENNEHFEMQRAFLRVLLKNYHVIILGYSLQDTEILQLIANKPRVEPRRKIAVIIDSCNAKKFSNQIDARYWKECCEDNIEIYSYSTEKGGFKEFEKVVRSIKKNLCSTPYIGNILSYIDPKKIEDSE